MKLALRTIIKYVENSVIIIIRVFYRICSIIITTIGVVISTFYRNPTK